jgi:hypothetical protein
MDLKSQYDKIATTVNASQEVLDTQHLRSKQVIYLDVKHVIPCAMVLMQIAMMGLDLKPGDEVITADLHLQQLLR